MDRSLRSFLQQADDLHEYLEKFCIALSADQIEAKVVELQSAIKTIQSVSYQLANVSNIASRVIIRKRRSKKSSMAELVAQANPNTSSSQPYIDPLPTDFDIGTLRSVNPTDTKEIVRGISVPIHRVSNIREIPVQHMYYVEDVKQFAINIEGIVLRGNLGNITEYQSECSANCEYGVNCKSFTNSTSCPYYHDPSDYIFHNKPVPDRLRNFTAGSWIYSKSKTPKTYFTRHLGDKSRLIYDLNTLKRVQYREEISNREGQLIHDLIIYMILNSRNLLERYPQWKHMPKS